MAVLDHAGLRPTALTTPATHEGPVSVPAASRVGERVGVRGEAARIVDVDSQAAAEARQAEADHVRGAKARMLERVRDELGHDELGVGHPGRVQPGQGGDELTGLPYRPVVDRQIQRNGCLHGSPNS